jgi:hypothetical protein
VHLDRLTTGERLAGIAGALLIVDLLFLPWHQIDLGIVSVSRTGVQSPNAAWGVIALLLAIAVVTVVVLVRLVEVALPSLPIAWSQATVIAAAVAAGCLLLKLLVETELLGFGAVLGLLLAGAMAYGTWIMRTEGFEPNLAPTSPVPPGSARGGFCGSCGAALAAGSGYCPKCGTPVVGA